MSLKGTLKETPESPTKLRNPLQNSGIPYKTQAGTRKAQSQVVRRPQATSTERLLLGFRVSGLGFWVKAVKGSGFRV